MSLVMTSVVILLALLAPVALAAGPVTSTGSVVVSVNGTVDLPAGTSVNTVVVVDGTATISGDAQTVVVVNGTATMAGATVDELVVVDGRVDLLAGTSVGDVSTWRGTITQDPATTISGRTTSFETDLAALAILLVPLVLALTIGFAIAAIVAGLVVAAFASRQVREAEAQITRRPGHSLLAGLAGTVGLPIIGGLLILSVIGAPIGFVLLFGILPVLGFLGWLVAAIWIGEWLLERSRGQRETGRPYRAAVLGVIVLAITSILPFVSTIATLFGLGALLLVGWRILQPQRPELPGQPVEPFVGPMAPAASGG
jgi:magnesium-transporting ATPase (P-type)